MKNFASRVQRACPENFICEEDIPIKTCENNFILIQISNESKIVQENNCVKIFGSEENILKNVDEFLYNILK
jgi:hypothetical protein